MALRSECCGGWFETGWLRLFGSPRTTIGAQFWSRRCGSPMPGVKPSTVNKTAQTALITALRAQRLGESPAGGGAGGCVPEQLHSPAPPVSSLAARWAWPFVGGCLGVRCACCVAPWSPCLLAAAGWLGPSHTSPGYRLKLSRGRNSDHAPPWGGSISATTKRPPARPRC
jgi:hypothetical protein